MSVEMVVVLVAAAWIVCGVLAYGLAKNDYLFMVLDHPYCYTALDEATCIFMGLCGFLGLLLAISVVLSLRVFVDNYRLGLCYRMPKELCRPGRSK